LLKEDHQPLYGQNRGQKVFNRGALSICEGALRLCEGLDIQKLTKTPLVHSVVFHISIWKGLELCFGG